MRSLLIRVLLLPVAIPIFCAAAFTAWLADNAEAWNGKTQKASRNFLKMVEIKFPLRKP